MTKKYDPNVTGETSNSLSEEDGDNSLNEFVGEMLGRPQELGVDIADASFDQTNGRLSFYFEAEETPEQ